MRIMTSCEQLTGNQDYDLKSGKFMANKKTKVLEE